MADAEGHTPGLQIVRVHTARGWVVVASDAMHYYANHERGVPFAVVTSIPDHLAEFRRIAALAPSWDHVVKSLLCVNRTHGDAPRSLHAALATTASFDFSRDVPPTPAG